MSDRKSGKAEKNSLLVDEWVSQTRRGGCRNTRVRKRQPSSHGPVREFLELKQKPTRKLLDTGAE